MYRKEVVFKEFSLSRKCIQETFSGHCYVVRCSARLRVITTSFITFAVLSKSLLVISTYSYLIAMVKYSLI